MQKLLLVSFFLFCRVSNAGLCWQTVLGWLGKHTIAHRHVPAPTAEAGIELKPGYHASPRLDLDTIDPAFSKTVLRYGPGAYFYVNPEHAERHATSITKGQIKKDRKKYPAMVYEGWIDVTNVFDTRKNFTRAELQKILDTLPDENLARLEVDKITFPINGNEFYSRLSGTFVTSHSDQSDSASLKNNDHQIKTQKLLIDAGIKTILGVIPDPNTGEWHEAYISLVPVRVK